MVGTNKVPVGRTQSAAAAFSSSTKSVGATGGSEEGRESLGGALRDHEKERPKEKEGATGGDPSDRVVGIMLLLMVCIK